MTLYAVELYTPSGDLKNDYGGGDGTSLTPTEVLERSLTSRLPDIFELGAVQLGSSVLRCVGLTLPLVAAGGVRACVSLMWRIEAFAAAIELWRPDASGVLRLSNSFYGCPPRSAPFLTRQVAVSAQAQQLA